MRSWMDLWKLLPIFAVTLLLPVMGLAAPRRLVRNPGASITTKPVEYGTASWYGPGVQGRLMASGERFNEYALSAAHRTLPLGTTVTVTNLLNGRSVTLRIKDRGPFVSNRLIDLSRAAATRLGFIERGLARVRVEVVSLPSPTPTHAVPPPTTTEAQLRLQGSRP